MIIKGATLCDHKMHRKDDIRIQKGIIVDIGTLEPYANEKVIDATHYTLLPSLIDINITPRDKHLTTKNLFTLVESAHKGGVGSIVLMPDCQPRIDSEESIEFIKSTQALLNFNIFPSISSTKQEGNLAEISILHHKGGVAIFLESSLDGNLMRRICEYSLFLNIPIICRCEDSVLRGNGVMNDSYLSSSLGLPGIPSLSEVKEVAKMGEVAVFMNNKILFSSLSSERSFNILQNHKKENPHIYTECSIHHLSLTEDICSKYNTSAKLLPPLKSESTRKKLLSSLKKGKIDILTSLHSASSITKKDLAFEEAAFGIESLDYYYSLLYTFLVHNNQISLSDMSKYSSYNPACFLGVNKGEIAINKDADFILVDTQTSYTLNKPLSPYDGQTLYGNVIANFVAGECQYSLNPQESL